MFTVEVVKNWNRTPSRVVDAACLSVVKKHLNNTLNNTFQHLLTLQEVRQYELVVALELFQLDYSIPFWLIPLL